MYIYDGFKYSEEEIKNAADKAGLSIEDYISKNAIAIEDEPQDFPTSTVEDADAVQQQMTASQAGFTELPSVDTPSDSQDPKPRYLEFKSGTVVYEDTYLETKAGKPGYPNTFDEYAAAFGTKPKEFSAEEITVKSTPSENKLIELKEVANSRVYNKETKKFESTGINEELFSFEEEGGVKIYNKLFEGSNIDFVETDARKEGFKGGGPGLMYGAGETADLTDLGLEAIKARILNPETGEYVYSEDLEFESDGSIANSDKLEGFIDANKGNINVPKWTRSKNKLVGQYKNWLNTEYNPMLKKAEFSASEQYLTNDDLFKPVTKTKTAAGYNVGYTYEETVQPYQSELAKEVNKLKAKNPNASAQEIEDRAKLNVRTNLYEASRNESIYNIRQKFIENSSNKDEAQAFLYASETFVKDKEAKAYNESSEKSQIAADEIEKNIADGNFVAKVYSQESSTDAENNKINEIAKKYQIQVVPSTNTVSNTEFNSKFNLPKDAKVSENLYNLINAIDVSREANANDYKEQVKKSNDAIANISDLSTSMDATAKNYELAEKYATNIGLGFSDIGMGIGYLGGSILTLGQSDKLKELGSEYVESTNNIRNSYVRDVSIDDAFSSAGNTGKFVAQEVSNQIPILAAMMMSGGAASFVVGASSMGGKMMDMENEIVTGKADYSGAEVWLKSAGYGLAEGVFSELTTVPILNRAKLNWMGAGKEQIIDSSTKAYFKSQSSSLIYEPLLEAAGEIATTGAQNLIDGKPVMQDMKHSGVSGLGFGFAFAAIPFMKGMYNSQFSTYKSREEIRDLQKEIKDLGTELDKSLLTKTKREIERNIKSKTEELNNKIQEQDYIIKNNFTSGGIESVSKLINIQADLENKAKEIQADGTIDSNTRAELISDLQNKYNNIIQAKQKALSLRSITGNQTEWEAFKGLNRSKSKEYLDTAESILSGENGGKKVGKEAINAKAYDLYFGDIVREENKKLGRKNSSLFKNFKSFETVEDAINDLDTQPDLDPKEKQRIIKGLKNGNDGYADPNTKAQVAVVENQVANQRRYTKTHEVGHQAFWSLLGNKQNNAAFKGISNQLLETLKSTDEKVYNQLLEDGIRDDDGNIDPTEVISRFLEYVNEDKITNVQKAKGVAGLFGVMVQKEFNKDYNFDFRGEQDIFNFVVGVAKKIKDGTLTTADIKKAKESDIIKSLSTQDIDSKKATTAFSKSLELQEQLDNLDEFDFDNEVDFQTAKTNLETKIRLAKKKELSKPTEEAKPKDKTKDDTKKNEKRIGDQLKAMVPPGTTNKDFKEKVAIKVIDDIDRGMLNPLIKKIAAGYGVVADNVYGKSWDDFFIEVAGVQLKKNIMSFNPESNDDLGGYIIGSQYGVRNRVKEALAKFKKEGEGGFKEDISVAKDVTAREEAGPQEVEKRKYTPLTKSNVIPNFTVTAITDKLTKVLSGLTTKMTDRRGDNSATTPLIAEIKRNIGKVVGDPEAAPKLVIQRLGKLKDGTYEKNLVKNKKAIIENMTTTFLMGKDNGKKVSGGIPQAIEKSVGGKFTGKKVTVNVGGKEIVQEEFAPNFVPYPEWVGQKIDREKTLVRGATAGNEIVRRVSADKVSDADFVGLFIDEKGKLIRGKREALGKALAEEVAFEIFTKEIQNENSEISKAFEGNQEAQGEVLSDNFVNELTRDIDRGTVKFSLSTGDVRLDKARTNLGKYITSKYKFPNGLSNEQFYGLVKTDDSLKELFDTLKKEYKRYLGRIKTDRMTELAVKFNASGNDNFNVFLNNYFDNKFSNISSALGVDPNSISRFKIKEETARKTKSFLQDYILDLINKDPKNAAKTFITTLQSALASGTKQSLFGTNENLYKFIKSIKDDKVKKAFKNVKLVKSASGLTFQIGKEKVTTKFKQETSASDFNSLINDYINNVEVDKRNEYADKAANAFLNFIDYLKDNKIDPEITGLLLNSLGGSMRSSAKTLAKIKGAFIVEGLTAKDYTFEHGIPTNQLLVASALYIYNKNNNINESFLKNIIDKSSIYIIPTKISDAIDSFYRNTFSNDKALSETNPEFYRYFSKNKYFQNYLKDKGISQFEESNITNLLDPKAAVKRNIKFSKSLAAFDPKGKVYKPSDKFSKTMNSTFNKMLERKTGIAADETISKTIANRRGQKKGKYKIFMPSSLDDFKGLTSYTFAGKGKQGEADQKFFQDTLIDPYFKGIRAIEETRQAFKDDFRALNKQMKPVVKKLGKLVPGTEFTHDQAIRVALWNASGYEIPGISEVEQKKLVDYVNDNADLSEYARKLQQIAKRPKWAKPGDFWDAETILSDLNNLTEKVGRKEFLSEFIENAGIIFSEENLNKVQAGYGKATRDALGDILYRMENGTNRPSSTTDNTNRWNTWINNSIGAIMFFNRRSALLQTLSTVNFINWSDNNPLKAAAAFANQKQYWSDFATLFNSSKLKQRRAGLKSDVNEAEIARAVKGSKNKATAALSYLLKIGFTPTQMADSFAIAAGGATFYRNRIKSYLKKVNEEGEALYTKEQAEEMAFKDFSQISEETQQSGDPALISSDQASTAGRLLLAFQNTPIQLNRSIKKAALDIKNRRRTPGQTLAQSNFSNFSKIIYYGTIQNIIFSALQNALFALIPGFEEEDDELTEEEQLEKYGKVYSTKQSRIINGMIDTTLKGGFGLPGAGVSMIKNLAMEYNKQEEKEFMADHAYTILAFFNIIPSIGSKGRKIYSAIQTKRFEKDVIEKRDWDITIDGKFNLSPSYKVLGSLTEGFTNLPLDRAVTEVNALTEALDYRNTVWQRVALALGWRSWDVGAENEEHELIKTEAKAKRKEEGKEKAKATRAKTKKEKAEKARLERIEKLKRMSK
jgi:hypothetical protein